MPGIANDLRRRPVGPQIARDDKPGLAVLFHRFPEEYQCRFSVSSLRDIRFQHLALVNYRPPKVVNLTARSLRKPRPDAIAN